MLLEVSELHKLNVVEIGNPNGVPIVYLHGGPGGSISEKLYDFFDLDNQHVFLFDQRGCGKSLPFAELRENNIHELTDDIEKIREHFNIDTWHVTGGSFGTTLALCYAIKYPKRVKSLTLRGIFLGRESDIKWLFQDGTSYFFPDVFKSFKDFIPKEKQHDLLNAYYEIFKGTDEELKREAAFRWSRWEKSIVYLVPKPDIVPPEITDADISLGLLECHYFANKMFWEKDSYILDNVGIIKDIPTRIVHGRYDIDCRPSGALELAEKLNNCSLEFIDAAGHSCFDENIRVRLTEITHEIGK